MVDQIDAMRCASLLLSAIVDNPTDHAARYMFADLVWELGRQEHSRIIHEMVACDVTVSLQGLPEFAGVLRGGFVEGLSLPCSSWVMCGKRVCLQQPIRSVRLTDKEPFRASSPRLWPKYRWYRGECMWALPASLFDLFPPGLPRTTSGAVCFETQEEALATASQVCLQWASSLTSSTLPEELHESSVIEVRMAEERRLLFACEFSRALPVPVCGLS